MRIRAGKEPAGEESGDSQDATSPDGRGKRDAFQGDEEEVRGETKASVGSKLRWRASSV